MGWLGGAFVQVVITSVVLGALRRAGVVRVDPQAISNPTARDVFTNALSMGEAIAERGERLWNEISRKVVDKPVHVSVILVPKHLKLMQSICALKAVFNAELISDFESGHRGLVTTSEVEATMAQKSQTG